MLRAESEPFFIFGEEDFAWEEPGDAATAAAVALPAAAPLPVPRRRRRQTRTFAGDIERLANAVGLSPLGLAAALAFVVVAAVAIRMLVGGAGDHVTQPKTAPTPASVAQAPLPGSTAAPPIATANLGKTFEPGDRGAGVLDLQTALVALGFSDQGADGDYGPGTAAAVAAFQSERGLEADGVAGPLTAHALVDLAAERASDDGREAEAGLAAAVQTGRLRERVASSYRKVLSDSLAALSELPPGRAAMVGLIVHDVAVNPSAYDRPRALTLFGMLEANVRYLSEHPVPAGPKDIEGNDGIVYRHLGGRGIQFHPLANFAHLNRLVQKGDRAGVRRLTNALAARSVRVGKGITWEYYFPFGGPPTWTSGLAQAAAVQALARAGQLLGDRDVSALAGTAYRAIPAAFTMELGGGLWIREYSFSDMAVLNAQLQSLVSISHYAKISADENAEAVVARMATAASALLPRFDTGCWSRYSLDGSFASLHYHTYHVALLRQLARGTGEPVWSDTATRWANYLSAGQPAGGSCS